ncbi:MAG: hypothetical protein WBA76_21325 [Phormidesmis sp.]
MKRKYKRFLIVLSLACLSVVLVNRIDYAIGLNDNIGSQSKYRAEEVLAVAAQQAMQDPHEGCRPYGSRTAEIIARAVDSRGYEHVFWLYTRGEVGNTDTGANFFFKVTTLLGPVCGVSYDPFVDTAITDRIELDTARSLSLQSYQHSINEASGIENFKSDFKNNLEEQNLDPFERPEFTSVDVWVWKQIGLNVPSDQYVLQNIDRNYKYDKSGPIGF